MIYDHTKLYYNKLWGQAVRLLPLRGLDGHLLARSLQLSFSWFIGSVASGKGRLFMPLPDFSLVLVPNHGGWGQSLLG